MNNIFGQYVLAQESVSEVTQALWSTQLHHETIYPNNMQRPCVVRGNGFLHWETWDTTQIIQDIA